MQVFFHFMQSSYSAFSEDLLKEAKPVGRLEKKKFKNCLNEQATGIHS